MKKTIIILFFILAGHYLLAQNKITGTITDQNNLPLPGATIFLSDMNRGTISDVNGNYELLNIPNGKINIQFSFIGYTSRMVTVEIKSENKELDIVLNQSPIESEEVVISGVYNATQHDNSVKIDLLKLNPFTTKSTPNFSEVLVQIPGVDMISKGSGVSKPVIRGLSMNDILVLNNGVRFENYQYSDHHPLGIDEFGIENVEVIKGPASLLYGSDAIGGVINFIKEKPAPVNSITGDYNLQLFSNTLGVTNNFGIKGASDRFFGGIRAGQKTNADFLQGGGDFAPNSRFNEVSVKTNAGYSGNFGTFKLFYDYGNQKLGLVEDEAIEDIAERGRKNEIWYQEFNTHLISSQNKLYFSKVKIDLNSAYQNTELTHFAGVDEVELQMQLATLTYEAKLHLPAKKNSEYIVGFQGINQKNTNLKDRETILLPDAKTNNYSLFGLLQHTFFSKLKLQSGIRYDDKSVSTVAIGQPSDTLSYREAINRSFGSFSGSVGATYNISDKILIRTNLAAAYRTPNLAELTSNGQHELRYEIGDKNLNPEDAYEVDLSFHYHKENLTFEIAGFYNRINNYIFISPTGDTTGSGLNIYKYKQENSHLYGGEAGIHFHPKPVQWLSFETTFSIVNGKQVDGTYLPFVPAPKLRCELRADKDNFLSMNKAFVSLCLNSAADQNNNAPDETATKSYTLLDFSIGISKKVYNQPLSLSLSINNLTDKKYVDHLSTLKEAGLFNPGRNVTLNLRIPFEVTNRN